MMDVKAIVIIQKNIPFNLCRTGPALSVILTQSEPVDNAIPIDNILK